MIVQDISDKASSALGEKLWTPGAERIERANITAFARWLEARTGRAMADYESLRAWSVEKPDEFWQSIWEYFGVTSSTSATCVLESSAMPGARWFPGARVNFAQQLLSRGAPNAPAILYRSEGSRHGELTWCELRDQVFALAREFRQLGVRPGDRIAGYLPTIPEAAIALLATTLIGAVWSCCSQDFGVQSVLDRFAQIQPKILIVADGYRYAGKDFGRAVQIEEIATALPSLSAVLVVANIRQPLNLRSQKVVDWQEALERGAALGDDPVEDVSFDHPLWIVYTSGTTGLPKSIVHGHGGVLLELLKCHAFHFDLRPSSRIFFHTATGWIMFPVLVGALLSGCSIVLYDGAPTYPQLGVLWQLCAQLDVTHFGTSPSFVSLLRQERFEPREYDLESLECVVCTGSPLTVESFTWIYAHVKADLWVTSISGGTDVVGGLVGGVPTLPVYNGEIQARCLGMAVQVFDDRGNSIVDREGELVVTAPAPSMPLYFWNDRDGSRYRESYFNVYPGTWRHGDLMTLTARGTCIISGRADATLNRHGIRIGTGEIYRCLESMPEIRDSLIVNLELSGGRFFMPLFVALQEGVHLDDGLVDSIRNRLRREYSPRHVPDMIYEVRDIPYTITGKKTEVPVKRILMGADPSQAVNRGALLDPTALDDFISFAARQKDYFL